MRVGQFFGKLKFEFLLEQGADESTPKSITKITQKGKAL